MGLVGIARCQDDGCVVGSTSSSVARGGLHGHSALVRCDFWGGRTERIILDGQGKGLNQEFSLIILGVVRPGQERRRWISISQVSLSQVRV